MAKVKEIKYNFLQKTANNIGVLYHTANNVNYIGNSFCVVYGMNDEEFKTAIEKTKAEENDIISEQVNEIVEDVKGHEIEGEYTRVCYDSYNGLVNFFRSYNGAIVAVKNCFFEPIKNLPVNKIYCYGTTKGLVIELADGRTIVIMPYAIREEKITKIIQEIYK